jgi:hypothetical protein
MNRNITLLLIVSVLIFTALACGFGSPTATPDNQAIIDAAIAATSQTQMDSQATIDAAVQTTDTAQTANQAAVDAAVQATPTVQASSQAATTEPDDDSAISSEQYVTMTEEELATLIDQTVAEAVTATEQSAAVTTDVTADNIVTAEEVETVEVYVAGAEEAIALAEELLYVYDDLYGDVATETVLVLEEISESLLYLADSVAALNETLTEINSSLEQGVELAEEVITELEIAAQAVNDTAGQIQEQRETWAAVQQAQIEEVVSTLPSVEPNQIITDPTGAIQMAFDFMETGQQALADGQLSPDELTNLAQQAANTSASLNALDNAQLQQLSGLVNTITEQVAQGDLSQAQEALNQLGVEVALSVPPNQVASDLQGAVQIVFNFAETGQQSLADGNISAAELANLAQLGANATASMETHGGAQLQQLSGSINNITGQMVRGNISQAQELLSGLNNSLGAIPNIEKPSLPDIDKPSMQDRDSPSRPSR